MILFFKREVGVLKMDEEKLGLAEIDPDQEHLGLNSRKQVSQWTNSDIKPISTILSLP